LAIVLFFPVFLSAQNTRNLLVIQGGYPGELGSVRFAEGLHEVLDANVHNEVFNEYLDQDRVHADDATLVAMLRKKYQDEKFDLIVGAGLPAVTFLLAHGPELWPGTPQIFIVVDSRLLPARLPPNTAAIAHDGGSGATLDLALQLLPNTRRVFYAGGSSPIDKARQSAAAQDFQRFAGKIEFTYLSDLTLADLLDRLGHLPDASIVIYGGMEQDASGHAYIPARLCPLIAYGSNAAVFAWYDTFLGSGIVGGSILDFKELGTTTGNLGLRILDRGTASGLPVENWPGHPVVDWRQLERWGISEERLPSGAIVRFRTPSAWERYKWYVLAGLAAIVVLLAIVAALLIEMRKRRKADLAVKDLSGRLIHAREEEQRRIARELHDDISQRLALVVTELDQLDGDPTANRSSGSVRGAVQQLREIIHDTHNLSRELHSSKLELLGLEAALKDLCGQLARQHGMAIEVIADKIPFSLPENLALCFYRVAQEALHNSVKHSRATRVEVRISVDDGTLRMRIKDYGSGFDPLLPTSGLGLATMRERLRLVKGSLVVKSNPGGGTEVTAEAGLQSPLQQATSSGMPP
ncbi:MAG TPA: ATP-binding protein, partial [Candidatus Angelobacter sp.]